ncbi:DUF4334 domain-containing protein [Acaryochloris sp. IP29b_bin.148]|uniref:DUF4334 domain-containing protein n=1 Tax=Acaryochloris sp. IP29b_bin.148 TaxID=2969218 RepID=UPI00262B74DF|nr:DUF4334 domain-containing protein [Acaryochloris sp. IP29b_bin.148]
MISTEKVYTKLIKEVLSTDEVLNTFDELEPVDLEFMISRWRGAEVQTHHPLNGFLEATNWYGKEFVSADQVHPLLFTNGNNNIFKVAPNPTATKFALRFPILKSKHLQPMFKLVTVLSKTEVSHARIRMMEYRHKVSATMIYDNLPINDIFRKIDEDTVLGLMDQKGVPNPFFFILKRDK